MYRLRRFSVRHPRVATTCLVQWKLTPRRLAAVLQVDPEARPVALRPADQGLALAVLVVLETVLLLVFRRVLACVLLPLVLGLLLAALLS